MTDKEILKALGLSKKSCLSEMIVQTTHHWLDACEKVDELEKENAELKEELKKWKDEWQEQVQKATDEGYTRTLQTIQLTKAKVVLRNVIDYLGQFCSDYPDCVIEAEKNIKGGIRMTDEEMAKEYTNNLLKGVNCNIGNPRARQINSIDVEEAFLAGLKAGRPEWHKVADGDLPKGEEYGKNSIHRDVYLKDRYGNLYTGNYYPKDKTHTEDCFAVEVLEWGFQGSRFCKKEQVIEWCEIPKFEDKE